MTDKILLIDDDEDILLVVKMLLDFHGFETVTRNTGEGLMPVVEEERPALILMDVSLRGLDGRDLTLELKGNEKISHIPVVLFSANVNAEKNYQDYKADGFIAKPFDIDKLVSLIRQFVPEK
jgi:CheY-like chemotaxis protein